jgi:hypothetical protein
MKQQELREAIKRGDKLKLQQMWEETKPTEKRGLFFPTRINPILYLISSHKDQEQVDLVAWFLEKGQEIRIDLQEFYIGCVNRSVQTKLKYFKQYWELGEKYNLDPLKLITPENFYPACSGSDFELVKLYVELAKANKFSLDSLINDNNFTAACHSNLEIVKWLFTQIKAHGDPKDKKLVNFHDAFFYNILQGNPSIAPWISKTAKQYGFDSQEFFFAPSDSTYKLAGDVINGLLISEGDGSLPIERRQRVRFILDMATNITRDKLLSANGLHQMLVLVHQNDTELLNILLAYCSDELIQNLSKQLYKEEDWSKYYFDDFSALKSLDQIRNSITRLTQHVGQYTERGKMRQEIERYRDEIIDAEDLEQREALQERGVTKYLRHVIKVIKRLDSHPFTEKRNILNCYKYVRLCLDEDLKFHSDKEVTTIIKYVARHLCEGRLKTISTPVSSVAQQEESEEMVIPENRKRKAERQSPSEVSDEQVNAVDTNKVRKAVGHHREQFSSSSSSSSVSRR